MYYIECKLAKKKAKKKTGRAYIGNKVYWENLVYTVDQEIFAVKKFLPVAWAAKIKRAKIKYTYTRFIAEPSGGEN